MQSAITMSVPAWKKAGLKLQENAAADPLATVVHLKDGHMTNKVAKKLTQKRRLDEAGVKKDGSKKPPKRTKLPKLERQPPPEKDQLAYLRQYLDDRDNWKFSKQKQNWILKNIETIPVEYEAALVTYIEGIQGGARYRLVDELQTIRHLWNKAAEIMEAKIEAELNGEDNSDEKDETSASEGNKDTAAESTGPSKDYAVRCQKILTALLGETVSLRGVENEMEANDGTENKEPISEVDNPQVANKDTEAASPDEEWQAENAEPSNLVISEVEVTEYDFGANAGQSEVSSEIESAKIADESEKLEKDKKKKEKRAKKAKKVKAEKK